MKISKLKKKYGGSPIWPALLSGLIAPGAGQILNREYLKGIALLLLSLGVFSWFINFITQQMSLLVTLPPEVWKDHPIEIQTAFSDLITNNSSTIIAFNLLMLAIWVYGIVDAYLTARTFRHPQPKPDGVA